MGTKDLQFIRFTQPAMASLIPQKLFEQLVEADEQLTLDALIPMAAAQMSNPNTFFFGIVDPETRGIVGFLWAVKDALRNRLVVFWMSILPEYQQNGILHKFFEVCKGIVDRLKLDPTIELYSLHPGIPERYGATPGKTKIYEFDTTAADYGTPRRKEANDDVATIETTQ
jgi:hypothetical protein